MRTFCTFCRLLLFPWLLVACADPLHSIAPFNLDGMHMIAAVEGNVVVRRAGWKDDQTVPVLVGTTFSPGDELQISEGAKVTVICADLSVSEVTMAGSYHPCPVQQPVIRRRGVRIPRTRAAGTYPLVLSPRLGKVLTQQPSLRWFYQPGDQNARYQVHIVGSDLERKTTAQATTSGLHDIPYPTNQPPLVRGETYEVVVETDGVSSDLETLDKRFQVLTEEEATPIWNAEESIDQLNLPHRPTQLLLARLFLTHELYAEAFDALEGLDDRTDPVVAQLLGDIYFSIELPEIAAPYYLRALKAYEEAGIRDGAATAHMQLGIIYGNSLNQQDAALSHLEQARQIYQELGDINGLATTSNHITELTDE